MAGFPVQVAFRAAHVGTATGLGGAGGVGLGDGLGVGMGDGVGLGLGEGKLEGLERAITGPFAVQPARASSTPASASPLLTGM